MSDFDLAAGGGVPPPRVRLKQTIKGHVWSWEAGQNVPCHLMAGAEVVLARLLLGDDRAAYRVRDKGGRTGVVLGKDVEALTGAV